MIECWICGQQFEPRPEKLKAWAESEQPFDPMDWECFGCISGDWDDGDDYYDSEGAEH